MKTPFSRRFGFLVNEIARLYSQRFDRLSRERLGLSQAQCRVLAMLAAEGDAEVSQADLAQRMGVTPMAIASLCDRMAAAGWIERVPSARDRRVNLLKMKPRAAKAMEGALAIGDELNRDVLSKLSASERAQLLDLLAKAREGLQREPGQ